MKEMLELPGGTVSLFEAAQYQHAIEATQNLYKLWGYTRVHPPMVDFYEAHSRFFSRADAERIYRLIDRNGQVLMLRSDITIFLIKHYLHLLDHSPLPLRLSYNDSILRYEGSSNEHYQAGVELIGTADSRRDNDLEILLLLCENIQVLGLERPAVHIGSRKIFELIRSEFFADVDGDPAAGAVFDGDSALGSGVADDSTTGSATGAGSDFAAGSATGAGIDSGNFLYDWEALRRELLWAGSSAKSTLASQERLESQAQSLIDFFATITEVPEDSPAVIAPPPFLKDSAPLKQEASQKSSQKSNQESAPEARQEATPQACYESIRSELNYIVDLAQSIKRQFPELSIRIDPSEIGSHEYYSGLTFQVYSANIPLPVATGGCYDRLLEQRSDSYSARGFSIMLSALQVEESAERRAESIPSIASEFPDLSIEERYARARAVRRQGRSVCL